MRCDNDKLTHTTDKKRQTQHLDLHNYQHKQAYTTYTKANTNVVYTTTKQINYTHIQTYSPHPLNHLHNHHRQYKDLTNSSINTLYLHIYIN